MAIIENEFLESDNFSAFTVAKQIELMKQYIKLNAVQGPQGEQGQQGEQGPQGIQGTQGEKGPQGEQGQQGNQGIQGTNGLNYPVRTTSYDTSTIPSINTTLFLAPALLSRECFINDRVFTLLRHTTSNRTWLALAKVTVANSTTITAQIETLIETTGLQGPQGIQGPQGLQGPQGQQGNQGIQGPQGIQGIQGEKGTNGNDFTIIGTVSSTASLPTNLTEADTGTAYFVGTSIPRNVYSWSILENSSLGWVNQGTLQGPQGIQGPQGVQGQQGEQGPQGPQGLQGPQGEQGDSGALLIEQDTGTATDKTISQNKLTLLFNGVETDMNNYFETIISELQSINSKLNVVVPPNLLETALTIFSNKTLTTNSSTGAYISINELNEAVAVYLNNLESGEYKFVLDFISHSANTSTILHNYITGKMVLNKHTDWTSVTFYQSEAFGPHIDFYLLNTASTTGTTSTSNITLFAKSSTASINPNFVQLQISLADYKSTTAITSTNDLQLVEIYKVR